jgi:hypothetical protein
VTWRQLPRRRSRTRSCRQRDRWGDVIPPSRQPCSPRSRVLRARGQDALRLFASVAGQRMSLPRLRGGRRGDCRAARRWPVDFAALELLDHGGRTSDPGSELQGTAGALHPEHGQDAKARQPRVAVELRKLIVVASPRAAALGRAQAVNVVGRCLLPSSVHGRIMFFRKKRETPKIDPGPSPVPWLSDRVWREWNDQNPLGASLKEPHRPISDAWPACCYCCWPIRGDFLVRLASITASGLPSSPQRT